MNLQDHINEQRSLGFRYQEIISNLVHKGYDADEIKKALQETKVPGSKDSTGENPVGYKKFIPLIILIIIYIVFFKLLPDSLVVDYDIFLALTGSILCGIYTFKTLNALFPALLDKATIAVFGVSLLSVFVFGVLFITQSVDTEQTELKQYGVLATAVVIDGSESRLRRSKTASITVKFTTEKDETVVTDIDVTPGQLDQYYKNQQIQILYSSNNPQITRHIHNSADLEYLRK